MKEGGKSKKFKFVGPKELLRSNQNNMNSKYKQKGHCTPKKKKKIE